MRAGRRAWTPYLLISPAVLAMLAFLVYPMASVFYYSLRHHNVSKPWDNGFAGLDNFARMLTADPLFWQSLGFTAKWVVVEVTLQLLLGLALALIVNETFVGRAVARALVFSPWAVSGVLTTGIWVLLYNPTTGMSRYLADLGLTSYGAAPLADPDTVSPRPSSPSCGAGYRSSPSCCSPVCRPSLVTSTRRPRSTAPPASAGSATSRCRTCGTPSSCGPCCARSGSSTTSTCSTP